MSLRASLVSGTWLDNRDALIVSTRRQLPLPLSPLLVPTYDNYYRGSNGLAVDLVQRLREMTDASQLYLWGPEHSGKTHLLLAAHNEFTAADDRSFYASLKEQALSASLLESLDRYSLVVLDDIDHVAGNNDWERALFNLINFSREQSGKIIFGASSAPASAGWLLADLESRLGWGPVLKLELLNEADIREVLLESVNNKGLEMPGETVDYLLKRHKRDVGSLLETVAVLDRESLAAGRARITIPFLKSCRALTEMS